MLKDHIFNILNEQLGYNATSGQKKLIDYLPDFITEADNSTLLLVKGFAGTGKTTVLGALVRTVKLINYKIVLLAPTGRAAKVLSSYCNHTAFTIHKKIYRQKSSSDYSGKFVLDRNLHSNTIFIVDEASMIANSNGYDSEIFGTGRLLDDLLKYVYSGKNCKLILAGDTAQLPPVGLDISPALDSDFMEGFGLNVKEIFLSDIVRQGIDSGILFNATNIRYAINENSNRIPQLTTEGYNDISRVSGPDLLETINSSYDKTGIEETIVITRSNKRANKYNEGIRNRILYREEELSAGDLLMVVKNNYYWLKENEITDFIANGDIIELVRIRNYENLYNMRFANALVRLIDYPNLEFEVKLLINSLNSETASLPPNESKQFFNSIMEDYSDIKNRRKIFEKLKSNPYYNALQIKFAYAVTCHKAQGGQWKNVFIDQGYFNEESANTEYLRWLYTAFTRSTTNLYLINFSDNYFI